MHNIYVQKFQYDKYCAILLKYTPNDFFYRPYCCTFYLTCRKKTNYRYHATSLKQTTLM